jgi:hypothetical protein
MSPCHPNTKTDEENNDNEFSPNKPFPDIPFLVLETDLVCNRFFFYFLSSEMINFTENAN